MKQENIVNLFLICCSGLFAGITFSLISPFYPSEALSRGVSVTQSGLVIGTVFITKIVFTPLCGKYILVLGAKKFLLIGFFIVGLGNLMFGFLSKLEDKNTFFALSILFRFIIAIGQAAAGPASYTLAGKQVARKNSGKAISAVDTCFGVGSVIGPTAGGCLYDIGGFPLPFWVSGITMIFITFMGLLFFKDGNNADDHFSNGSKVSWLDILKAPGIAISIFAIALSGVAWNWSSASLEPFMGNSCDASSSQTGLIFTTLGVTYTLATPVFGFLTDKGLDGLLIIVIGYSISALGFIFLGPIPPLSFLGSSLWMTFLAIGVQGIGFAATYIGTLLYMMKSARESGLPDNEQTIGMVSSLFVVSDCVGGFTGSAVGGIAYDTIGFEWGSMVMALSMIATVLVVIAYYMNIKIRINKQQKTFPLDVEQKKHQHC